MLGCVVLRAWTDVAIARSLRPRFPQVPLPFVLPKRRHVAGRVGLQHRGASLNDLVVSLFKWVGGWLNVTFTVTLLLLLDRGCDARSARIVSSSE